MIHKKNRLSVKVATRQQPSLISRVCHSAENALKHVLQKLRTPPMTHDIVKRVQKAMSMPRDADGSRCGLQLSDLAEIAATLDKLPLTADEVRVVPGSSRVYKINEDGKCEASINWNGWAARFLSYIEKYPESRCGDDPRDCYSTKEAAEAAHAAAGGDGR